MILSPLSAAILATLLMYLLTALGAALVFPLRRFHPSVMNPVSYTHLTLPTNSLV